MNLIFVTQAEGLRVFYNLKSQISYLNSLEKIGFSVADRYVFEKIRTESPEIDSGRYHLVKEWELTAAPSGKAADEEKIQAYEKKIGDHSLWNALVADRRLYLGRNCRFRHDYKSSFNHQQMLTILERGLVAIENQFEKVRPDAVFALNAVTFADYLYYLFAKYYRIPYFQLKLTRIENYVSMFTEPFELSRHISDAYQKYYRRIGQRRTPEDKFIAAAKNHYASMTGEALSYEGAITTDKRGRKLTPRIRPARIYHYVKTLVAYRLSPAYRDKHFPGLIRPLWHRKFRMPLRAKMTDLRLSGSYVPVESLANHNYAFYPMHTEPEVALSVYGRPHLNQIELIRNLSMNLPVTWKLVVKDHPNSWGFHSASYYKKILAIPNVLLVSARIKSKAVLDHAKLVVVVNGTIGLEAVVNRIPLITLGYSPYYVFPDSMVRHVSDIYNLGLTVKELIKGYQFDQDSVLAYLAAHIAGSIRINLFTDLLQKSGRKAVGLQRSIEDQYRELASYALDRIQTETKKITGETYSPLD